MTMLTDHRSNSKRGVAHIVTMKEVKPEPELYVEKFCHAVARHGVNVYVIFNA